MNGHDYLLDTVIVAAYFNQETAIREKLSRIAVYVSSITIGELYFGAYNSQQRDNNVKQIRNFIDLISVLNCDSDTADYYGHIRLGLKQKGRPIPENDIWIAAVALQHDLTLATRDAHFSNIEGLRVENW